jgi:hypothetical protein
MLLMSIGGTKDAEHDASLVSIRDTKDAEHDASLVSIRDTKDAEHDTSLMSPGALIIMHSSATRQILVVGEEYSSVSSSRKKERDCKQVKRIGDEIMCVFIAEFCVVEVWQ